MAPDKAFEEEIGSERSLDLDIAINSFGGIEEWVVSSRQQTPAGRSA